jgi:hypothetical protein
VVRGRIDAFFSALEIRFPGNGDRSRQRLGSKGELLGRKPKHLVLAGPFGRQVGEADYSHAMRKPPPPPIRAFAVVDTGSAPAKMTAANAIMILRTMVFPPSVA